MALRNLKQQYPDIIYICVGYGDEENNLKKLITQRTVHKIKELSKF